MSAKTGNSAGDQNASEILFAAQLFARIVQSALLELCFEHRSVLVLREVEGLSCEEVASALGVPEGTVKSRLSRAREAMRRKLAGLLEGEVTS